MNQHTELDIQKLHDACRVADTRILQNYLHSTIINAKESKLGWTPLYRAVVCGHVRIIKILLQAGAQSNLPIDSGATSLSQAVAADNYKIASILLKNGADPNVLAPVETALHMAILNKSQNMIKLLMRFNANVHFVGKANSRSPLDYALASEDDHIIRLLLGGTGRVRRKMIKDLSTTPSTPLEEPAGFMDTNEFIALGSNPLYAWLEERNLEAVFTFLDQAGYDSLESLQYQVTSDYPLTEDMLNSIGIIKPGHRKRLLHYLKKPLHLTTFQQQSMLSWLSQIRLQHLHPNFINAGFDDLDFCLHSMLEENVITDKDLRS